MKIWATVDFGKVKATQEWEFLAGEIGGDSEPHDFIQILVIGERKQLVIQLEKQAIAKSESGTFYLGGLKIADAVVLP